MESRKTEKLNAEERLKNLEALVEELLKDNPQPDVVKGFMKKTGLSYQEDPIANINSVLQALHFQTGHLDFEKK